MAMCERHTLRKRTLCAVLIRLHEPMVNPKFNPCFYMETSSSPEELESLDADLRYVMFTHYDYLRCYSQYTYCKCSESHAFYQYSGKCSNNELWFGTRNPCVYQAFERLFQCSSLFRGDIGLEKVTHRENLFRSVTYIKSLELRPIKTLEHWNKTKELLIIKYIIYIEQQVNLSLYSCSVLLVNYRLFGTRTFRNIVSTPCSPQENSP